MQTKFRLSVRWLCFAVLLAAVVVRLAAQPGLRAHLVSVAAPTQAAEDAPEPAQDGSWPTLCYEPPSHDAPDLPAVTIDNRSGLPLEPDALPEAALALDRAQEGPLVLIIHTHATEAYAGSPDFHSTDPEKSIQMVLDVHRDSLETDDGTQLALRADVDGEACAKLLLVMGSNGSGLEHPGWRQNLANAAHLQALCEQRAPGLMRDLLLRASRYNQHLTPRSMLLEVGTAGNSLEEALRSADVFSRALADCLLGKA